MEEYEIPIFGMKEGIYDFGFSAGKEFFEHFGNPEIPSGKLKVGLKVIRRSQFLEFHFEITGSLRVTCDRCLEDFDHPAESEELLYVRYGERSEEVADNIVLIPAEQSRFNIAPFIYEYAVLSLPIQKIHPEGRCNPEMLKKLNAHRIQEEQKNDPRWDILKKLK